jgi:hypothetical protein
VTLVDGNGVLHPHGFGLASHFGVVMGIPTIGVGKTFLHVDGLTKPDVKARMADAHTQGHASVDLVGNSGKVIAAEMRCSLQVYESDGIFYAAQSPEGLGSSALRGDGGEQPDVRLGWAHGVTELQRRDCPSMLSIPSAGTHSSSGHSLTTGHSRVGIAWSR